MATISLEPGDSVLFCSDGITDTFNTANESFGPERVQQICETHDFNDPAGLLGRIFAELEEFARGREQHDDMTAAVLRLEP